MGADQPASRDRSSIPDDAVAFVAAVDELLVDTRYQDAVVEDFDVFVATGLLLCRKLADGADPSALLTAYVEALGEVSIGEADDETLTLAGSILGTAVGYLCPEHSVALEDSLATTRNIRNDHL